MSVIEDIRASYTIYRGGRPRRVLYYRGALRRRSDDGAFWECEHEHESPAAWNTSAQPCAQAELRRRQAEAGRTAPMIEGAG